MPLFTETFPQFRQAEQFNITPPLPLARWTTTPPHTLPHALLDATFPTGRTPVVSYCHLPRFLWQVSPLVLFGAPLVTDTTTLPPLYPLHTCSCWTIPGHLPHAHIRTFAHPAAHIHTTKKKKSCTKHHHHGTFLLLPKFPPATAASPLPGTCNSWVHRRDSISHLPSRFLELGRV